jgi:hypothetical protein
MTQSLPGLLGEHLTSTAFPRRSERGVEGLSTNRRQVPAVPLQTDSGLGSDRLPDNDGNCGPND